MNRRGGKHLVYLLFYYNVFYLIAKFQLTVVCRCDSNFCFI